MPIRYAESVGTPNVGEKEYRDTPALNASALKQLYKSPYHYWHEFLNPHKVEKDPTKALNIGTAVHGLVLEGEQKWHEVPPEIDRRYKDGRKAYAEWLASLPPKAVILKREEAAQAMAMAENVLRHPLAEDLLYDTHPSRFVEHSIFWEMDFTRPERREEEIATVPCKARLDLVYQEGDGLVTVVDLKTTQDASHSGFMNAIARYSYHIQAAFYFLAAGAHFELDEDALFDIKLLDEEWYEIPRHRFIFIAVETFAPYAVAVYEFSPQGLNAGLVDSKRMIELYLSCEESEVWPSYNYEDAQAPLLIDLPGWARKFR